MTERTLKILLWGALPLLGFVFTAGGGWLQLSSLQEDHDKLRTAFDEHLREHDRAGYERRITDHERRISEAETRYQRIERNVIAICIATGASCADP